MSETLGRSIWQAAKCAVLLHRRRNRIYVSPSGRFVFCTACRNTLEVVYPRKEQADG